MEEYDSAKDSLASYYAAVEAKRAAGWDAVKRDVTIGECRLLLGDCLEILPLLTANSIDMIWTDPPYGHGNHDGDFNARLNEHRGIEDKPIANDDGDSMRVVVDGMLTEAARLLKADCCCCCCCCGGGGGPKPTFAWVAERMDRGGLSFFHSVIWDKANPGLGWRYRRQHEMVMIAHREGGKLLWANNDRAARNIFTLMPPRDRVHPNQKPLGLMQHFIELHTVAGQIVLDPFMGSGSTGVAAAKMGRRFIGIESDAEHFDTAVARVTDAHNRPDMFIETARVPEPTQEALSL
jgi:site-specific DNA-methyltransferase (adenine-specific)